MENLNFHNFHNILDICACSYEQIIYWHDRFYFSVDEITKLYLYVYGDVKPMQICEITSK